MPLAILLAVAGACCAWLPSILPRKAHYAMAHCLDQQQLHAGSASDQPISSGPTTVTHNALHIQPGATGAYVATLTVTKTETIPVQTQIGTFFVQTKKVDVASCPIHDLKIDLTPPPAMLLPELYSPNIHYLRA